MTGRLALFALGLLAAGCSLGPVSPRTTSCLLYQEDPAFDDEERGELAKAAQVWRDSGVCVAKGRGDVRIVRVANVADVPAKYKEFVDGNVALFAHDERAIFMFMTEMRRDQLRGVFIHEMGHAMGAHHLPRIDSCLFPKVTEWCAFGGHVLSEDVHAVQPTYQDH